MTPAGERAPLFAPGLLAGRTAMVTGASGGLGHHFAKTLGGAGARVALAGRRVDRMEARAMELRQNGVQAVVVAMDVRDGSSVRSAVQSVVREAGAIDILVNNSGIALTKPLLEHTDEDWDSVVDTNLSGAFRVAREVARTMVDGKHAGAIVNVASILGLRVARQLAAYIASKAALLKLTEAMAVELAPHRIRVNAIAPGYISTELNEEFLHSPAGEMLKKRIPIGRFGDPSDLDAALLLLVSDASAFMTGSVVTVDGGHHVNAL
jgi:NAD(P)-dependent dehydrogenase (short-subunit alcohol dehydrogenase family)